MSYYDSDDHSREDIRDRILADECETAIDDPVVQEVVKRIRSKRASNPIKKKSSLYCTESESSLTIPSDDDDASFWQSKKGVTKRTTETIPDTQIVQKQENSAFAHGNPGIGMHRGTSGLVKSYMTQRRTKQKKQQDNVALKKKNGSFGATVVNPFMACQGTFHPEDKKDDFGDDESILMTNRTKSSLSLALLRKSSLTRTRSRRSFLGRARGLSSPFMMRSARTVSVDSIAIPEEEEEESILLSISSVEDGEDTTVGATDVDPFMSCHQEAFLRDNFDDDESILLNNRTKSSPSLASSRNPLSSLTRRRSRKNVRGHARGLSNALMVPCARTGSVNSISIHEEEEESILLSMPSAEDEEDTMMEPTTNAPTICTGSTSVLSSSTDNKTKSPAVFSSNISIYDSLVSLDDDDAADFFDCPSGSPFSPFLTQMFCSTTTTESSMHRSEVSRQVRQVVEEEEETMTSVTIQETIGEEDPTVIAYDDGTLDYGYDDDIVHAKASSSDQFFGSCTRWIMEDDPEWVDMFIPDILQCVMAVGSSPKAGFDDDGDTVATESSIATTDSSQEDRVALSDRDVLMLAPVPSSSEFSYLHNKMDIVDTSSRKSMSSASSSLVGGSFITLASDEGEI